MTELKPSPAGRGRRWEGCFSPSARPREQADELGRRNMDFIGVVRDHSQKQMPVYFLDISFCSPTLFIVLFTLEPWNVVFSHVGWRKRLYLYKNPNDVLLVVANGSFAYLPAYNSTTVPSRPIRSLHRTLAGRHNLPIKPYNASIGVLFR